MIKEILEKLALKNDLTKEEMQSAVESIMTGKVDDNDIETFLIALNEKRIKEPEITAAAMVMKDKSLKFDIGDGTHIDTCGTGGTGLHTFNCSTASSFVAAAGGASITKHGNKAISSKSGSADFLTEAGADISHDREKLVKVFDQVGFIFLFAPLHHQSMKYVMPARQRIGEKTIFNLLGPHTNPCGAKRQIIGVYDKSLLNTFSTVAKNLDMEHVMVVHGDDGLDEISISGPTNISEYKNYKIKEYTISPQDFGISISPFDEISAQSSEESLRMVREAFSGERSAVQDMIALNAGAGLYIARKVDSISDGIELAYTLMNNGKAADKLAAYVRVSNS
ncbi:anthranilate phosphoribosyltransferase [Gammaproteobacteria bacterium]|jgi:anthranilate phosphoribosyltransferase|nr:anthranilate phosphoribosyltransferase [Gammaproteobacteria bacterium]MDA8916823.1 anthranilate phosphoribosyltransferase [Gammaproteobacteria bacterium]MDA9759422.1 anthranilate phosphoribosyltransferase [Gammaproteobacteria bacterium]MDA9920870.1 anthranilate phosphoribosyltransferase [Gammaproteobacteria bacterium]MDB2447821.1 anthranilate phosphoribosyltransferase [Gammaproteobacteria bacterium]